MEQLRNAFESISNWWFDLHYTHNQKRSLLIIGLVLLLLSIFIVARGNTQISAPVEITPITIAEPEIFVDVTGAVNKPGVYTLTGKSRVIEAIKAAGDLEPPAQHEILGSVRTVDIYKVCHHGSKYQDEQLMSALSAQIAVISVGAKNSYGHPAPETIATLTRLGTQVVRTDLDGAIAITAKAHHLRVRKSKGTIRLFYWS